jgi:DNA-binding FadR family transcriptional regulator
MRRATAIEGLSEPLASGQFPAQSRLPPERQLMLTLSVSRGALRDGLEVLEAQRKIWRHVGKRTFVGRRPPPDPARLTLVTSRTSPLEVLEVRLLIEPMLAGEAALRATSSDIDELWHLLEKSETARDAQSWELWDGRLHRMVAESAHNSLLLSIFDAFNSTRTQAAWAKLRREASTPERREDCRRQHRDYVAAIAARDPARATEMMRRHIEAVREGLYSASAKPVRQALPMERRVGREIAP